MNSLKDLNLSFNSHLTSLPKSISNLINLKKLSLESCSSLRILTLTPRHLPLSLEELNLSNSSCLQGIKSYSSSSEDIIPNLRVINISGIQLQWISFKNYSSLENIILQSNANLQFLDLSGTKITKFPLEGICKPHLNGLTRLDLLGVKHIYSVHWNDIDWLPLEVYWDECGDGSIEHMQIPLSKWRKEGSGGVFLSLTSANILQTLSPSSQLWETCLSRFLVYICPCADRGKGKAAHPQKKLSQYKNINTRLNPCPPCHERCLEIEGGNLFRRGIAVLSHTNFLYLHDSTFKLFSNLGLENMNALTECRIERCHEIEVIFDVPITKINQPLLTCLEKLQISNLMKLTYMCTSEQTLNKGSFSSLKHLQLEYCARVVKIFSSGVFLENLKVLDIKFCARLEEIFSGEHEQGSFPQLQTLFLSELPSLKHIVRDVPLLSLEKAQIKGCLKLRTLPISSSRGRAMVDTTIVIKGESEWWEQLEWKDNNMKHQICFIPWKPFKYPRGS
ncbi:Disease resistance protein [Thalictrum thalictroides]|uniref:Disease resistance protein n=1 Tax=Thalictrum thalictroides TaxID=46969 RepID=A0A7J6WET4_THATH|nr:Disease resistance protein [Thalictrum thalictroides]